MAPRNKGTELLDPLEDLLGYQLRRASMAMMIPLVEAFGTLGLRLTEAVIIWFVQANPGCNQGEIGRALGIQRTNMVPIVAGLVEDGLIEREAADGRTHALSLTAKGKTMQNRIARAARDHEQAFFGDLDDARKAALRQILLSIRETSAG
jgi:DNA-binding MarR family transcriptional regulator